MGEAIMGCDIHAFVEVRINGEWESYAELHIGRDYQLFARMAGVRNYDDTEPIAAPRGLPDGLSPVVAASVKLWGTDAHSSSWLSATEAKAVQDWYGDLRTGLHDPLFGYVFGNYIDSHIDDDYCRDRLKEIGCDEARVVFWFDN
jgi:hypothetical protein